MSPEVLHKPRASIARLRWQRFASVRLDPVQVVPGISERAILRFAHDTQDHAIEKPYGHGAFQDSLEIGFVQADDNFLEHTFVRFKLIKSRIRIGYRGEHSIGYPADPGPVQMRAEV